MSLYYTDPVMFPDGAAGPVIEAAAEFFNTMHGISMMDTRTMVFKSNDVQACRVAL